MRIYNLVPRLAGPFAAWPPHLERAAAMGFDWVFVNPVQRLGRSESLYSIADYFQVHPIFLDPGSPLSPEDQLRAVAREAAGLGLQLMTDLVLNHCAVDAPLVRQHPDWLRRDSRGQPQHPYCVEPDGSRTVWRDLAQFDHRRGIPGLLDYGVEVALHLLGQGFTGFRCDAAYQIPPDFWRGLIKQVRATHPGTRFVAETLGCTPDQTRETAAAGFDFIYNSAKWWDFREPWLLEQYELTRQVVPSIGFPESHDTPRLAAEPGANEALLKQRYLFTALFSAGVMLPIGYEYGFRKPLHVIHSRPADWETPSLDLRDFITRVNGIKAAHPVFQEDGPTHRLDNPNPQVLMLWKAASGGRGEALLILNQDPWNWQHFHTEDLYRSIQSPPPLLDVSPEWPMDHLPAPFDYDLPPGVSRVLVTRPR